MDRSAGNADDIFFAALEIEDAAARSSFLAAACGPDAGLRARVEALVRIVDPRQFNFTATFEL